MIVFLKKHTTNKKLFLFVVIKQKEMKLWIILVEILIKKINF